MLLFWHYLISSSYFPLFTQRGCVSYKSLFKAEEHHNCQVTTSHYVGDKVSVKALLRRRNLCFAPLLARVTERRKSQGRKACDKVQNMVLLFLIYFTAITRGMQRRKIIVQEPDYFTTKKDSH